MIKLLTLKLKLIITFIVLIVSILATGYFYLNKMSVKSGNLNINKTNPIDRLCNYSIYSDFYYRIVDFKNNQNSYAELLPVKTTICYDFKTAKIALNSNIDDGFILDDNYGTKIKNKINYLHNFVEDYSKIVSTQDKDYFDKSYTLAKETYNSLYSVDTIPINKVNIEDYYTNIPNLPIDNMKVNYYNLTNIKQAPTQVTKEYQWQPNILKWNFGENDSIYLQYLMQFKGNDLEDYVENIYKQKKHSNKTIVKLTKFNNNKLSKMFIIFDDNKNKITTLFMDENGYIYNLILKVQNKKAFKTYFNDYMKIAYGIYFVKKDGFVNKWAIEQDKTIKNLNDSLETGNEIVNNWNSLGCTDILNNYNEAKFIIDFKDWNDYFNKTNYSALDKKFDIFKSKYGYPTNEVYMQFYNANENIKLIKEGIDELGTWYDSGCELLVKKCSDSLECIKNLKNNNWEEE